MTVVVVDHPYYPTDLQINNYVPNTRSTLQLLVIAGSIMTALIGTCMICAHKSTTSTSRFTWFTICGAMHILFEGYWLLHRSTIAGQSDLFAELWKEYAHGDSRYLSADELLLTLELMTIFIWGPLCIISAYYIWSGSRKQYFFQLVASLCHLFSCSLYYIMDLPEATHCDPNPIYFYVYFISFNAPWIIVPLMLVYQSYSEIIPALTTSPKSIKSQ